MVTAAPIHGLFTSRVCAEVCDRAARVRGLAARKRGDGVLHIHDVLTFLASAPSEAAKHELTAAKAALLGLVEGVTELRVVLTPARP